MCIIHGDHSFTDGTFGWLAKGRVLEVFSMQTSDRWAAWCFGSAAPDLKTVITTVCQFGSDSRAACLAVATAQTTQNDFNIFKIYLFDICKSSIVKVIQLPFQVRVHELQFLTDCCLSFQRFFVSFII